MTDLGQFLADERVRQGKTLDEMQEITKIRRRYIEAIEEGRLDILPGKFYIRAFIKQYCESLGLVSDDVFQQFAPHIPADVIDPTRETKAPPVRPKVSPEMQDQSNRWILRGLFIAFPLLIGAVLYYFILSTPSDPQMTTEKRTPITQERSSNRPQELPSSPQTSTDSLNESVTPQTTTPVQFREQVRVGSTNADRYDVVSATGTLEITVAVNKGEAWVGMSPANRKNKYVYQAKLDEGQSHTQTMDQSTYIVVGRANALTLTVNGVAIDLGDEPSPRRIWLELQSQPNASAQTAQ